MDVAKVDWDVAYVAIAVHVCCKHLFPMFHLFFRRMLQVLYLDIAYVFNGFSSVLWWFFASVSGVCF
jgi:hypothetical protein